MAFGLLIRGLWPYIMLNKKFFAGLKKDYDRREGERRQIIGLSSQILHDSKRVIFSLHRGDEKKAAESLKEIEDKLAYLGKKFGHPRLKEEGSYKAGMEEYVEAKMYYLVLTGQKIDSVKGASIDTESYLGGICDLTGELVRLAVNRAAEGKADEAEKARDIINEIMAELVEFDMTGYMRTKYDQARTNLRKIEQIGYELKIRGVKE
jgi:predicted translin family RNA/ssDNA-binding protein